MNFLHKSLTLDALRSLKASFSGLCSRAIFFLIPANGNASQELNALILPHKKKNGGNRYLEKASIPREFFKADVVAYIIANDTHGRGKHLRYGLRLENI